jgi:nucleoside-diphosphate-sugar epimerase
MEKLLITGASGFLGLAALNELAACGKYDIYAVTTGRRTVKFPVEVHVVVANLLNREQSRKVICETSPDIMLHLAWELSEPGYLKSDTNLIWLEESLFLLRTFAESGGKYFAFAGSSAEYGHNSGFSEINTSPEVSLYGNCKNSFHNSAIKYCADNNIGYANLRYFPVLGSGMRTNTAVASAIVTFLRSEKFVCKAPYNVWDFVSINDAAKATTEVIAQKYRGTVNIASGIPRIMGEVFTTIAKKMRSEHLLSLDYSNTKSEILTANTEILNNVIGYKCSDNFSDTLDGLIASVRERTANENQ